jgi:hypothetical protein
VALAVIIAACGSDAATTTTDSGVTATTLTSTVSSAVATAPKTTTTTTAPATTTTTERVMASADCLVGDWELDSAAFLDEVFAAAEAELDGGSISHGGGEYAIALAADGTFVGTRDNWQMRFEAPDGVFVTTLDGSEEGTWSVEGDTISIFTDVSNIAVSSAIEVDGELQELPFASTQTMRTDVFEGSGTFTCDGDLMTVTFEGITSELNRT